MSEIVIQVENVSKQYRLGQVGRRSLSHDVNRWWHTVRGKENPYLKIGQENDRTEKSSSEYVWALRDINFEIKRGEVLGIIGKNGAGKSTLLKLLSKVTSPSIGQIKIKGKIASLLEVGTGFHPDLSGRDNIFLNGAILGMNRKEIASKFDAIVDFAGVEKYIDTPVKRYSSGMYVRLAFAVAAHLEPDILIVDEVLAVGDAEFQQKCLGKMKDVSERQGRTVLFVSHQMGSISQLCNRAYLLQNGKLIYDDSANRVIDFYINSNKNVREGFLFNGSPELMEHYIKEIKMTDVSGKMRYTFGTSEKIQIHLNLHLKKNNPALEIAMALMDKRDCRVFTIHEPVENNWIEGTDRRITIELPENHIAPGLFSWIVTIHIPHQKSYHCVKNICSFTVVDTGSRLSDYDGADMGVVFPNYSISSNE